MAPLVGTETVGMVAELRLVYASKSERITSCNNLSDHVGRPKTFSHDLIRFLAYSTVLILRNFIAIMFIELLIFSPVFFFLFHDLRNQLSTCVWLDLR